MTTPELTPLDRVEAAIAANHDKRGVTIRREDARKLADLVRTGSAIERRLRTDLDNARGELRTCSAMWSKRSSDAIEKMAVEVDGLRAKLLNLQATAAKDARTLCATGIMGAVASAAIGLIIGVALGRAWR